MSCLGVVEKTLLAALIVTALVSSGAPADPARWEETIRAFETADAKSPPEPGGIVFVGSSSIRGWKTLSEDFPGANVINRGFGGSEMADSAAFASRIVTPYKPKMVFVYAGDNDTAAGKSPSDVLLAFRQFVRNVRKGAPGVRIGCISVKPSPSRWKFVGAVRETNRLLADYCRQNNLVFVDVFTPMLGADGKPRPELFLADNLHMTREGYRLWADVVRPYLPRS